MPEQESTIALDLRELIDSLQDKIPATTYTQLSTAEQRQKHKLEQLFQALKPFARFAATRALEANDASCFYGTREGSCITVGDLRRAIALIEQLEQGGMTVTTAEPKEPPALIELCTALHRHINTAVKPGGKGFNLEQRAMMAALAHRLIEIAAAGAEPAQLFDGMEFEPAGAAAMLASLVAPTGDVWFEDQKLFWCEVATIVSKDDIEHLRLVMKFMDKIVNFDEDKE